jgi:DNA-binding NarL/FixJ family response regulator
VAEDRQIAVLIADDHVVVRQGLRSILGLHPEVRVVGEAANGAEALQRARELKPDVVLMDIQMPVMDGIEATRQLRQHLPECKVVILTSFAEDEHIFPALQAGASGYLLKDVQPEEILGALRRVVQGEPLLHPVVMRRLMERIARPTHAETPAFPSLTPREQEVLRLIAQGCTNKEIAHALVVSEKTVKAHVSNLLQKLQLSDRTQAAIYAVQHGLVKRQ